MRSTAQDGESTWSSVWVNGGSGDFPAPAPWHNLDITENEIVHPDEVADIREWEPKEPIERLYLGHVLEHLDVDDVVPTLKRLKDFCTPEAEICIVGPDCRIALDYVVTGEFSVESYWEMLGGGGRWFGDIHRWICFQDKLTELVQQALPEATPLTINEVPDYFPVVSRSPWQCAARWVESVLPENGYQMCGKCGHAWKDGAVCPECGTRVVELS